MGESVDTDSGFPADAMPKTESDDSRERTMQPSKQERRGGRPRGVIPAQSGGHRAGRCIFSLAAVLLMAGFTAASADDADLCANQKFPPEIRIPACSHIIAWGQSNDARLAPSYRSRADAWLLSNDPD